MLPRAALVPKQFNSTILLVFGCAMAFLPEFETDIFISYARVDNETATRGEGWVAQFISHLEIELNRLVGRIGLVKLWWDPTLDDNQLFDDKIQSQINGSAIFLALTSNGYLKSDYCRKELRWFRECAEQRHGLKVGDRLRVVNVMLNNIPPKNWPDEFQGAIGSRFHDAKREDEIGQPPQPGEELFRKRLRKLSESIYRTLLAFPSAKPAPSPAPKPPELEDGFVVFLAEVSNTLETRRESVANELRQQGVRVIDNIPPPHDFAAHEEAVKAEIARADLAVHLLNDLRGSKFTDDASRRYPQRQVELGLEFAQSQLIWVPQSLDFAKIEDLAHRELLHRLENGDRRQSRYRFLRESPSGIAREVINRLKELEELKKAEELKRQQAAAALIDTHLKDQFKALELGRAIEENRWQPLINPSVDDPTLSAQILEDRLKKASKLIVLFGEVAQAWVDGRLREALHIALNTPNCPLRKLAVCFVKPQRKDAGIRFDLGFVPIHHYNLEELLDPPTLAEFLKS
ncbi:MAG TPA: toll/interleukin-1 receptor domain-containing protein [Blastocatellia bacterium]|nr:toll/interleukin-1 receptor domain-containing protein [Blastocatellia bacterium]HMV87488.1 toll/interleukin-1 receptor domain-containing protein [Blastocatellia bacterium]HMX29359.1 toll/interleukin-1 receptor domain-containing protein [Blastocatellia bacterium]HMY74797.1 toll/interleukin-1 receptor domain-containing protein [Blastocatellia bacterium]HMZ21681.1 toll/interleukin-1 receptor domain-containing protein [Blastocatellia bacterium]